MYCTLQDPLLNSTGVSAGLICLNAVADHLDEGVFYTFTMMFIYVFWEGLFPTHSADKHLKFLFILCHQHEEKVKLLPEDLKSKMKIKVPVRQVRLILNIKITTNV